MSNSVQRRWQSNIVFHTPCLCGGKCDIRKERKEMTKVLKCRMVTFLAAIAIASFLKMPGQPLNLVRGIFAFAWIFILPLIVWTVITGWETTQKMHWKEIAVVRWWHAASSKVKSLGGYKKGENGDVESGSITELPPLNEEIESESSSQDGKKARRPSWRPRFRVPGPVRRLTSNYF